MKRFPVLVVVVFWLVGGYGLAGEGAGNLSACSGLIHGVSRDAGRETAAPEEPQIFDRLISCMLISRYDEVFGPLWVPD